MKRDGSKSQVMVTYTSILSTVVASGDWHHQVRKDPNEKEKGEAYLTLEELSAFWAVE